MDIVRLECAHAIYVSKMLQICRTNAVSRDCIEQLAKLSHNYKNRVYSLVKREEKESEKRIREKHRRPGLLLS